jgi:hypothetical protein
MLAVSIVIPWLAMVAMATALCRAAQAGDAQIAKQATVTQPKSSRTDAQP